MTKTAAGAILARHFSQIVTRQNWHMLGRPDGLQHHHPTSFIVFVLMASSHISVHELHPLYNIV
jgi:hypothetical protein